jgi:hypothetical protein
MFWRHWRFASSCYGILRKDYNFRLTFSRFHSGDYLADIKVTIEIKRATKKAIEVISFGSIFFAQLLNGKYNVTAKFEGKPQDKTMVFLSGILVSLFPSTLPSKLQK